jgi:hypothetical protein
MARRPFQFRLRTLFVVMTAWAILCPFGVRFYRHWESLRESAIMTEIGTTDGGALRGYKEKYTARACTRLRATTPGGGRGTC